MVQALDRLGIEVDPVSQTAMYTSGAYVEHVVAALRARLAIDNILEPFRTRQAKVDAAQETGADDDEHDEGPGRGEYFPYRPYCALCNRDTTTVTGYDEAYTLTYECKCGAGATLDLRTAHDGKLVWKVDWPMRWAFEHVVFEPSGVDHQSPGSSFEVGKPIVEQIFGGERPVGPMYAFVGAGGMSKMSSSKGSVPTPLDALEVMEPQVLRWQYARRRPRQAFDVGFGQELLRLYDEWDATNRKLTAGTASGHEVAAAERASEAAAARLPATPRPLPFRTLASIIDISANEPTQLLRILSTFDDGDGPVALAHFEPRLSCARRWVELHVPEEDRTVVRSEPDASSLAAVSEVERRQLRELVDGLDESWSLDRVTTIVYGVPKLALGLSIDAPADDAVKAAQREFFKLVYRLTVGAETGPRLPTLLLAIGRDRARRLLSP